MRDAKARGIDLRPAAEASSSSDLREAYSRPVEHVAPSHGLSLPPVPRTCVICHSSTMLDLAMRSYPHEDVDIGCVEPTSVHFCYPKTGLPFAVVRCSAGAPMAALLLEELIAVGFKRFISVGSAGHPAGDKKPSLPIGGIVIASQAYVYEGTSSHYRQSARVSFPDEVSVQSLSELLTASEIAHRVGAVATTDAIYRETDRFRREISENGVLAIDMQLSAAFTVARFHGVEMVGLLYISGIVGGGSGWGLEMANGRLAAVEEQLFPLVMEYAASE